MQSNTIKLHSSSRVQDVGQAPKTAQRSFDTLQTLSSPANRPGTESSLTKLMLTLQTLFGAALSGFAVLVQLATMLACLSMLLLGPAALLGLLP